MTWINSENPKIFGIGLTKTGTRSLSEALTILGIDAIHYPWSLEDIQNHTASADIPVSCRYKNLDKMYPGSKFILTTRPFEEWLESMLKKPVDVVKPPLWKLDIRLSMYGTLCFEKDALIKTFRSHHHDVNEYFENRQQDLLVLELKETDKWSKLCAFLNKPIPSREYPHKGKSK